MAGVPLNFLPNAEENKLIQLIQKFNRNEYALIRLTFTMINKSIIDASAPIVSILRDNSIFEFNDAEDGTKYYKNSLVFHEDGIVETNTSFYRPKAKPRKPGDPRFWPWGFKDVVEQETLVYITSFEEQLVLIPLTNKNCTQEQLQRLHGRLDVELDILAELIEKLSTVSNNWIKSCSPHKSCPKDVGDTLEAAVGIPVNNIGKADYKGEIELKTKRSASKTADTLFSQVPDWDLSPVKSVREMMLTYGYLSRHVKRQGFKDLFVTVSESPNPQGLCLVVDYDNEEVRQLHIHGEKRMITAVWKFEKLKERLYEKHPKTAWLVADEKIINGEIHFKYIKLEISQKPIFSQFLLLIEQGIVCFDWRGGHEVDGNGRVDKGHAFRLKSPKNRNLLFGDVYSVVL